MDTPLHWEVLGTEQQALLPLLKKVVRETFYLGGETGLALQLGDRKSTNFEFFVPGSFDTHLLVSELERVFDGHMLSITREGKNTVSCLVDRAVECSFMSYAYPHIHPFVQSEYFPIASVEDIASMKLATSGDTSLGTT